MEPGQQGVCLRVYRETLAGLRLGVSQQLTLPDASLTGRWRAFHGLAPAINLMQSNAKLMQN